MDVSHASYGAAVQSPQLTRRQVLALAFLATACLVAWPGAVAVGGATIVTTALLVLGLLVAGISVAGAWARPRSGE